MSRTVSAEKHLTYLVIGPALAHLDGKRRVRDLLLFPGGRPGDPLAPDSLNVFPPRPEGWMMDPCALTQAILKKATFPRANNVSRKAKGKTRIHLRVLRRPVNFSR